MSVKTTVKHDSKIFNSAELKRALSNVVSKSAKEFKDRTRRQMIESIPSGRIYEKGRGRGFSRSHKASARGQRPAVDTGTLVSAVTDQKTSEFSASVFVAHQINPENGADAHDYAETLSNELARKIIAPEDIRVAEIKFNYDLNAAVAKLL